MKKDNCNSCDPDAPKKRADYLLWGTSAFILSSVLSFYFFPDFLGQISHLLVFSEAVTELLIQMSWGLFLGIVFVGILGKVPREFIMSLLGKGGTFSGIFRATAAGVLLDLCSHGILLVGVQLYKRGASLGQTMAFLIASPWNSLSLTLILWALVGFKWMMTFLLLSIAIALVSGLIFDGLVSKGVLAKNPNSFDLPDDFKLWREVKASFIKVQWTPRLFGQILKNGIMGSRMILRWIFLGIILAALIRTFIPPETFQTLFGPTLSGLGLTVLVATIIEVCSEGSTPIAADILTRGAAPGNAFAFLMTGVSTDYTEIISLKEATRSWKTAIFLPLVTLPQVIALALLLNMV
jgi:uncharacterized membrane protein YraQ (UPF0718 family)